MPQNTTAMKKLLLVAMLQLSLSAMLCAQNNVGINNNTPDASAALDVTSTTQGMLVPRMTKAQRDVINPVSGVSTPAAGLLIYQTDNTPGFYYYTGTAWTALNSSSGGGAGLQLLADKTGGTGETPPVASTVTPSVIAFNNILTAPGNGNTWTGNNTFTVGAGQGGIYMVQARLHGPDASPVTNSVPYSLIIQVNNTAYGNVGNVYGPYPTLSIYTPAGTKTRGEIVAFIKLNATDTFKVLAISANSSTQSQTISTDAGSNIMVMKMN